MKHSKSRRTTLTLPEGCLEVAERIAQERHLNLSSVVAEALQRGLREEEQAHRSQSILKAYSSAFGGFSADELLFLDGVVSEVSLAEEHVPKKVRRKNATGRNRK